MSIYLHEGEVREGIRVLENASLQESEYWAHEQNSLAYDYDITCTLGMNPWDTGQGTENIMYLNVLNQPSTKMVQGSNFHVQNSEGP